MGIRWSSSGVRKLGDNFISRSFESLDSHQLYTWTLVPGRVLSFISLILMYHEKQHWSERPCKQSALVWDKKAKKNYHLQIGNKDLMCNSRLIEFMKSSHLIALLLTSSLIWYFRDKRNQKKKNICAFFYLHTFIGTIAKMSFFL